MFWDFGIHQGEAVECKVLSFNGGKSKKMLLIGSEFGRGKMVGSESIGVWDLNEGTRLGCFCFRLGPTVL